MASVHGNPLITKVLGISAIVLLAVLVVVIAGAAINQQQFLKSARLTGGTAQAPASTGWMSDGNDPAQNAVSKSNSGSKKRGSKRVVRAEGSDDSLMNVYPRIKPSVTSQYHARYKDPNITATAAAPHRRLAAANVPYQQQQLHVHQQQQQQLHLQPAAHHRRPMQPRLPPQRPQAAAHDSQYQRQQQQQQQAPTMASTVADSQFDLNLEAPSSAALAAQTNSNNNQQQQLEPQNKLAPKRLLRGFGASVAPLKSKPKLVGAPQTHQAQSSHRRNEVLIM